MLFIGWEGVGLCSYLLIGFWFSDKANADAGKKAFIVNRIGDFGFLVAMFLMFANLGTLDFVGVNAAAASAAVRRRGRHGDLPLPVPRLRRQERADPALRLAARRDGRPDAGLGADPCGDDGDGGRVPDRAQQRAVLAGAGRAARRSSLIGALTAIFAATIGLKQWDIKKVLAYSTVSQLGYMFVGVGVGRVRRRRLPPRDARLLQGAAVPRLGLGDLRDARGVSPHAQPRRRAGHAQHGRPASSTCRSTCVPDVDRDAGDRRHSAASPASSRRTRSSARVFARAQRFDARRARTGSASRAARCCISSTCSASRRRS